MKDGTPVAAKMGGKVIQVNINKDYGNSVLIDSGTGYQELYAHLSSRNVKVGDEVASGTVIGKSGHSGNATGPHLHYELRYGKNNPIDPASVVKGGLLSSGGTAGLLAQSVRGAYESVPMGTKGSGQTTAGNAGQPDVVSGRPTGSAKAWASALLKRMGAPVNDANLSAMSTWFRHEGGLNHNNPLNTTLGMKGATDWNSAGVKTYLSMDQGVTATIETLTGKDASGRGYTQIINDFKSGKLTANQIMNDISNSAWVSGHTGQASYGVYGGSTSGFGASMPSGGGSAVVNNTFNMPITLQNGNDAELTRVAKRVKDLIDHSASVAGAGAS